MPTPIIPVIEVGPVSRPPKETKDLFDAATTHLAHVSVVPEYDEWQASFSLSLPSLSGEAINLRKFVDLANHVGLSSSSASAIRAAAEANIDEYIRHLTAIRKEILRLGGCSGPKFPVGSEVIHEVSGEVFRIMAGPDKAVMEGDGTPCYAYTDDDRVWVLSAEEMEDGSFVLVEP